LTRDSTRTRASPRENPPESPIVATSRSYDDVGSPTREPRARERAAEPPREALRYRV
jgi:hypothetical protein